MRESKNVHTNSETAAIACKSTKILHAYIIICAIVLSVAVCTWPVPPGQLNTQTAEARGVSRTLVIPGTFHAPEEKHPARLVTILSSPHRGFVGGVEVTMPMFLVNGAFSTMLRTGTLNTLPDSLL